MIVFCDGVTGQKGTLSFVLMLKPCSVVGGEFSAVQVWNITQARRRYASSLQICITVAYDNSLCDTHPRLLLYKRRDCGGNGILWRACGCRDLETVRNVREVDDSIRHTFANDNRGLFAPDGIAAIA